VDAIKSATEELQTRFQAISAELYKQAASQNKAEAHPGEPSGETPGGAEGPGAQKSGDHVVDADFEVVDDDKKKS
jgi:molecular chaperone DnaK